MDPLKHTLIHLRSGCWWRTVVPNGHYRYTLMIGDPSFKSTLCVVLSTGNEVGEDCAKFGEKDDEVACGALSTLTGTIHVKYNMIEIRCVSEANTSPQNVGPKQTAARLVAFHLDSDVGMQDNELASCADCGRAESLLDAKLTETVRQPT